MARLFVSDLDGTLLDRQGRLSGYSRDGLTRLLEGGLLFTVASARSVCSIRSILGDLPLSLPVIEFNGAFLSDLRSGTHHFCRAIQPPVAREFVREACRRGFLPTVSTFHDAEDRLYYTGSNHVGLDWFFEERERTNDPRLRRVASLQDCLHEQVVCLTVIGDREQVDPFAAWVGAACGGSLQLNCFDHAYSPACWLTAHDRRATKDQALGVLAAGLGLGLEEVTVFGDAGNDLPLFEAAGYRVAVANAVPELKALADLVIGDHETDSVVRYLAGCAPERPGTP